MDERPENGQPPAPEAELRTFLIADIRGYTKYTTEHGADAAADLATRFAAVVREVVSKHDGFLIELRGDEALAVFVLARRALRAALEMQDRFQAGLDRGVGIGLDAGEAVPVEGGSADPPSTWPRGCAVKPDRGRPLRRRPSST